MTAEVIYEGDSSLLSDMLAINDEDWRDYHHYLDSYTRKGLPSGHIHMVRREQELLGQTNWVE